MDDGNRHHLCANLPCNDIKPGSMGKPLPGINAAILDENGKPLPPFPW
ncbi:MAG: hypothetical protein R2874_02755 [Desulfobacterales bacterium]